MLDKTHRPVFHRDLVDGTVEVRAGSQRERRQVISPERAIVPIGRAECMARGQRVGRRLAGPEHHVVQSPAARGRKRLCRRPHAPARHACHASYPHSDVHKSFYHSFTTNHIQFACQKCKQLYSRRVPHPHRKTSCADLHFLCAKMHIRTHFCVTLPRIKYHILCLH